MTDPKALCIGINKFRNYPQFELRGCVNDVKDVHRMLIENLGFSEGNVFELLDEEATKQKVMGSLQSLIKDAKQGNCSSIFVHFSTHGTQVPSTGDSEVDHMDEAIVTHDIQARENSWDPDSMIIDDEIGKIISEVPSNVSFEIVLDCCHSGTAIRDIDLQPDRKIRYVAPPTQNIKKRTILFQRHGLRDAMRDAMTQSSRDVTTQGSFKNAVAWSACRDDQTAADANIENIGWRGAFSYYLCKAIRDSQNKISRDQLMQKVASSLAERYPQQPQLTSSPENYAYSFGKWPEPPSEMKVSPELGLIQQTPEMTETLKKAIQILPVALQLLMTIYSSSSKNAAVSKNGEDGEKRIVKSSVT